MARLTAEERKELPAKDFAGPGRSYPIEDKKHAKAALMLINKGGLSSSAKARVRSMAKTMLHKGVKS